MNFLIALVLVFSFSVFFQHTIKTSSMFFYIIACLITGTEIVAKLFNLPDVVGDIFYPMFANGIISMAMFTLVMFVGAVQDNSKFQKAISPIRSELSIIASILAFGHNFSVGITSLKSLSTWAPLTSRLSMFIIGISFVSIILMAILLVISFKTVHKKMDKRVWKKIQRLSYVLYTLIFTQILLVSMPLAFEGDTHYIFNAIVYAVTFLSYATMRLIKAFKHSNNTGFLYSLVGAYALVVAITVMSKATSTPTDVVLGSGSSASASASASSSSSSSTTSSSSASSTPSSSTTTLVEGPQITETDELVEDDDASSSAAIVGSSTGFVIGGSTDVIEDIIEEIEEDEELEELLHGDFSKYADGTYQGSGLGKYDIITVSITIQDRVLTELLILEHQDTLSKVVTTVPMMEEMVETQTIDIDVATGATLSSNGIKDAVRDALSTAPLL